MSDPIYRLRGGLYHPTELATSPWSADSQHGGPPSALLAHAIETVDDQDMQVVRVTVQLLRPVPMRPLRVSARVNRPGRRLQFVDAWLLDGDQAVAQATGTRLRRHPDLDLVRHAASHPAPPGPEAGHDIWEPWGITHPTFYDRGLEHSFLEGSINQPGPAKVWLRLRGPFIEGQPTTPLQRVMVAADCGNGVSAVLPFGESLFINPDLTVHLHRYPRGEWVMLEATTLLGGEGAGTAEAALWDRDGRLGRSAQSLLVELRPPAGKNATRARR